MACSVNPKIPSNWFWVGRVDPTEQFAFASKTANLTYVTLKYAYYPGAISLYGGIAKEATDASTTVIP